MTVGRDADVEWVPDQRGVSPVIGVVLLVAIVVTLAVVAGGLFLALGEEREPTPDVVLSLQSGDAPAEHELVHEEGDRIDGDRVELRGVADAESLAGGTLSLGDDHPVYPVDETVRVVWSDGGSSYVLWEFEVDPDDTVPEPDEGCAWVDTESDGGTESVKVDGIVVDCDVTTTKQVEVQNGGRIIGDAVSEAKALDADDAVVYGDATVEDVLNVQDGYVTGDAVSNTADVKLTNASVGKSATAETVLDLQKGSTVGGDARSESGDVKVSRSVVEGTVVAAGLADVDDSTVEGSVVADGTVDLENATVTGDVYVDAADFDCDDSTVAGQDCDEYTPKDRDEY